MRYVLLGAGRSGVGAASLLAANDQNVILINEVDFPEQQILENQGVEVRISKFSDVQFSKDDIIIKAPGIPDLEFLPSPLINEIELHNLFAPNYHLSAITGTNGKTTTTRLLETIFKKYFNCAFAAGNIGYSLSQAILDHKENECHVALEISAFQLDGLLKTSFDLFALMNLSPDHLDRYHTKENYYQSKISGVSRSKKSILNVDDPIIKNYYSENPTDNILSLSLKIPSADFNKKDQDYFFKDVKLFSKEDMNLLGLHNEYNTLFAAGLAYLSNVPVKYIVEGIKDFNAVEHRMEKLDKVSGINYYNDSKATNPEATLACISSFEEKIHLIAGGLEEGNDYSVLEKSQKDILTVHLYGENKDALAKIFPQAYLYENLQDAFVGLQKFLKNDDIVVFSPASASYDQFDNFEERGRVFKALVHNLKE